MKHWWLYILELEEGKYYVGITSKSPEKRFTQHKNGYIAARWTKKYKPIRIFDTKDLGLATLEQAQEFEGRATRKYMEKYGYNNVRGGILRDAEDDYILRFNRYFKFHDWEVFSVLTLQSIIIFILLLDKFGFIQI